MKDKKLLKEIDVIRREKKNIPISILILNN